MNITAADIGKKFRTRGNEIVTLEKNNEISSKWYKTHPYCHSKVELVRPDGRWAPVTEDHDEGSDLIGRVADAELPPGDFDYYGRQHRAGGIQNVLRSLPGDAAERKAAPVVSGCLDYFPLAIAEIARLSKAGNDQHNPGQPLHWARDKSSDHADCIGRHLIERGTLDNDGQRHTAKAAWRALALLQEELEAAAGWKPNAKSA